MFIIRALQPPSVQGNQGASYIFRIIKYFLLVSVTANFIVVNEELMINQRVDTMHLVVGSIVMGLYLLGKLQNRAMMSQLSQNPMFSKFIPSIDPKVERFLLIGSLAYFVACLLYPQMVNNGVVNWFTDAIINIYDTPIIGWIFSIIAFFFLISIILRAANVIGRLLNGQSLTDNTGMGGSFNFRVGGMDFENKRKDEDEDGFTDYEDVTEEESENEKENEKEK